MSLEWKPGAFAPGFFLCHNHFVRFIGSIAFSLLVVDAYLAGLLPISCIKDVSGFLLWLYLFVLFHVFTVPVAIVMSTIVFWIVFQMHFDTKLQRRRAAVFSVLAATGSFLLALLMGRNWTFCDGHTPWF